MINLKQEIVNIQKLKSMGLLSKPEFTDYWNGIIQYLNGSDAELSKFVSHYAGTELLSQIHEMWREEIGTSYLVLYRGFHWNLKDDEYDHKNGGEAYKLLSLPKGSKTTFSKSAEYPFQHWTTKQSVTYDFARLNANGSAVTKGTQGIIIKANVPTKLVMFATDYLDSKLMPSAMHHYLNEHEVIVWHMESLEVEVVVNSLGHQF